MNRKINPMGFLSLISLISLLGLYTGNIGWYGFLGFLYYLRYFWIIPDEGFWNNIMKSATLAFFIELIVLFPSLLISLNIFDGEEYILFSFGFAFCIGIIVFTIFLTYLEWKETKGIIND